MRDARAPLEGAPEADFAQRALATLLTRPWLAVGDGVFLECRPRSARALRT